MSDHFTHYTCCIEWQRSIAAIHSGLKMAAANGTPTKIDPMKFCPWCGVHLSQRLRIPAEEPPIKSVVERLLNQFAEFMSQQAVEPKSEQLCWLLRKRDVDQLERYWHENGHSPVCGVMTRQAVKVQPGCIIFGIEILSIDAAETKVMHRV